MRERCTITAVTYSVRCSMEFCISCWRLDRVANINWWLHLAVVLLRRRTRLLTTSVAKPPAKVCLWLLLLSHIHTCLDSKLSR